MTQELKLARECLQLINPAAMEYDEWVGVGMALKLAGGTPEEYDEWSRRDASRYKAGEPVRKWNSFKRDDGVSVGSLVKLARDQGQEPTQFGEYLPNNGPDRAIEWNATIGGRQDETKQSLQVVRQEWIQDEPLPPAPDNWDGKHDLIRYLGAVFQAEERVGIVTDSWQSEPDQDGKTRWLPKRGVCDRTAGELIELLAKPKNDIGAVIGDANPDAGAWIRHNPLDGNGVADANVTAFRHALVESDSVSVERQYAIYRQLELPISALVMSGGKSLHAIVKVDAPDAKEFQKRVDFLYEVCKKNGLPIDRQNRNASRLSRLPGVTRKGIPQRLVATHIGKATWAEWADWIAAQNDELPDVENLADLLGNLPPLADELISGILRKGHKMLISGPSKAGKSFLLLELAIALAEGGQWLGWQCARGRVLYVNLELDRASAYHRLAGVYQALGLQPVHANSIDLWNLRGKAMAMDELAPRLIRRAIKRQYVAVIIDPIYKVITGDENAADQMAKFCNQFDKVCHELRCAVIYCHHHSKGDQGQKRASDRASGSGVFARDPDALLDMIELVIDDKRRTAIVNRWECEVMAAAFSKVRPGWHVNCPQDDAIVAEKLAQWALTNDLSDAMWESRPAAREAAECATAWRVEGILREFKNFPARRCFFRYPIHTMANVELIADARAEGEEGPRRNPKEAGRDKAQQTIDDTRNALDACRDDRGVCRVSDVIEYLGLDKATVYKRVKNAGFQVKNGLIENAEEAE